MHADSRPGAPETIRHHEPERRTAPARAAIVLAVATERRPAGDSAGDGTRIPWLFNLARALRYRRDFLLAMEKLVTSPGVSAGEVESVKGALLALAKNPVPQPADTRSHGTGTAQ